MMKSISFLLGAGFSAPLGYPIGEELNQQLKEFSSLKMSVSSEGKLCYVAKDQNNNLFINSQTKYLKCCIKLIEEYSKNNCFDYEEFYDFIVQKNYLESSAYVEICKSFTTDIITLDDISSNLENIYNQMVVYLLKDRNNVCWYDNIPHNSGSIDEYDGFLNLLKNWRKDRTIHVHTLNHDMLFESFNQTDYLSGEISDGFDELGSDYYGVLRTKEDRAFHVRLETFTGRYNSKIRLYKLHGSLDYVLYYKTLDDGLTHVPDKYIKTRYGIGYDSILRDTHNGEAYERYPFAYHANFLTGCTSKICKYQDPLMFKHLFDYFKSNLKKSEKLIIIGYGCKDSGINDMILNYFHGNRIYFVDPYCKENSQVIKFARKVNAKIVRTAISNLTEDDFL